MSEPKRLFVLRHAKSSWDDPGLDDHERPLAPRGRRAVQVLSEHLQANAIHPTLVLCSTARRARETLEGVDPGGEISIESDLYAASAEQLIERLHRVPDDVDSVMVIGHNPALQIIVLRLTDDAANGDGSHLAQVRQKFPTGALATLSFDGPWSQLGPKGAELVDFVGPKAIARRSSSVHPPE